MIAWTRAAKRLSPRLGNVIAELSSIRSPKRTSTQSVTLLYLIYPLTFSSHTLVEQVAPPSFVTPPHLLPSKVGFLATMSTMSLEPPTYLSSLQNNIRARPIPWDGAVRAGSITEDHLKKIKAVDKVRKEQRSQTIEGDLPGYVSLLAGGPEGQSVLEAAARRSDIVQYILVLTVDLINGGLHPSFRAA